MVFGGVPPAPPAAESRSFSSFFLSLASVFFVVVELVVWSLWDFGQVAEVSKALMEAKGDPKHVVPEKLALCLLSDFHLGIFNIPFI